MEKRGQRWPRFCYVRTAHRPPHVLVYDVGVDLGGGYVLVPQGFLDHPEGYPAAAACLAQGGCLGLGALLVI